MTPIWLFLHFLGFVMWTGGGLASMVVGLSARRDARSVLQMVAASQANIQKKVIAPGALLVVLSGLILTIRYMDAMTTTMSPWLLVMQGAGLVGALITLLVGLPTASRLGRIDPEGAHADHFDALRARLNIAASVAGTLALIALFAGAMLRSGVR